MKPRVIALGLLGCAFASHALACDWLGDRPTKVRTNSSYEFGVKGLYQYDLNDFSSDAIDPSTGLPLFEDANTWRRKEFDVYVKAPNGLEVDLGYDWA